MSGLKNNVDKKSLKAKDSVQILREKRQKFFEDHQEFYEDSIR